MSMQIQPSSQNDWIFSAEELRQYFYCARIPFFRHVRKIRTKQTYLMKKGTQFHKNIVHHQKKLREWLEKHLAKQEKASDIAQYYEIFLESPKLHLLAYLDVMEKNTRTEEIYPVEIKTTRRLLDYTHPQKYHYHHLIQLTVQSLLVEEHFKNFVSRAKIIYRGVDTVEVCWQEISIDMKAVILKTVQAMHKSFMTEELPRPTKDHRKCYNCEYWNVCKGI